MNAVSNLTLDCDPQNPLPGEWFKRAAPDLRNMKHPNPFKCYVSVCQDENSKCLAWAKAGECDNNPTYMQTKCRKSCKNCKLRNVLGNAPYWRTFGIIYLSGMWFIFWTDVSSGCRDTYDTCELWALDGECRNNPGFMLVHCRFSCEYCVSEKVIEGMSIMHCLPSIIATVCIRTLQTVMMPLKGYRAGQINSSTDQLIIFKSHNISNMKQHSLLNLWMSAIWPLQSY